MSAAPQWAYVQARLQARHGERLNEADWRMLEAAKSLDHFIERSRATSLRRFTAHVNTDMDSHTIERVLRLAWRDYVGELASWVETDWQPALLWHAPVAYLPTLDALVRNEMPTWLAHDPELAEFAADEFKQRIAALEKSSLAPLTPGPTHAVTFVERWYAHWRALWPRGVPTEGLEELVETVRVHFALLAGAGEREMSAPYQRGTTKKLTRLFRRHCASPVAVLAHLALVALDLQRVRGNLIRRYLFASARQAA